MLEIKTTDGFVCCEDRYINVVMNDDSQIALNTDGIGTVLKAASPIVLSEVDYVLLGDGTKLELKPT